MNLLLASLVAGMMSVLAPCVLPILPVILSSSSGKGRVARVLIGLGASIIIFTLLIKALAVWLGLPGWIWALASGLVITFVGVTWFWPELWERVSFKLKLYRSDELIGNSKKLQGAAGDWALGASLGPVFSSCSPTFALILAIILPTDFWSGALYILVFTLGLLLPLVLIAWGGRAVSQKFQKVAKPNGFWRRVGGLVLILLGVSIVFGLDKRLETAIVDSGLMDWAIDVEKNLIK